jgi:hypothetical protein
MNMRFIEFLTEAPIDILKLGGFELRQYRRGTGGAIKIFHNIYDPKGKKHFIDHTPYQEITKDVFAKYVAFYKKHDRFPDRKDIKSNGTIDAKSIATLSSK